MSLVEMHKRQRSRDLYEIGNAIAIAYHEPKRLKEMLPRKPFDEMSVPAMLRIPKKSHG